MIIGGGLLRIAYLKFFQNQDSQNNNNNSTPQIDIQAAFNDAEKKSN